MVLLTLRAVFPGLAPFMLLRPASTSKMLHPHWTKAGPSSPPAIPSRIRLGVRYRSGWMLYVVFHACERKQEVVSQACMGARQERHRQATNRMIPIDLARHTVKTEISAGTRGRILGLSNTRDGKGSGNGSGNAKSRVRWAEANLICVAKYSCDFVSEMNDPNVPSRTSQAETGEFENLSNRASGVLSHVPCGRSRGTRRGSGLVHTQGDGRLTAGPAHPAHVFRRTGHARHFGCHRSSCWSLWPLV